MLNYFHLFFFMLTFSSFAYGFRGIPYFAYGANLDRALMTRRVQPFFYPTAELLDCFNCYVDNYKLTFNIPDITFGPAAASIIPKPKERVHGVCYYLSLNEYLRLCASEGAPLAYRIELVWVNSYDKKKRPIRAYTLAPTNLNAKERRPSSRYISLIRAGARERGLNETYCEFLDTIESF